MNLLYRMRNAMARFMYGRNGVDQLCWAMLALEVALSLIGGFVRVQAVQSVLQLLSTVLTLLVFYRIFSRNLTKRRAENAKFLYWWSPKRTFLRDWRYRRADKTHKYVKCGCGAWCRVPKGVGKVELVCPKCGGKTIVKT